MIMNKRAYFETPLEPLQKQYEALRAYYTKEMTLEGILDAYEFKESYFKKLRANFSKALSKGNNPFFVPQKPGPKSRSTPQDTIGYVVELRKKNHSIIDIQAMLHAKEIKLSLSAINNILRDEGFAPLLRRTRQEKRNSTLPANFEAPKSETLRLLNKDEFTSEMGASSLIFLPLLQQLGIIDAIEKAQYPGTSKISATSYILSFLALKLIGNERHTHDEKWNLDRGLGLFAGLNVLPKAASLSSYSYRITREMNRRFLVQLATIFNDQEFDGDEFNLDFKTIPHWGDESVLERNWAGSKSKAIKSILSLIAQRPDKGILVYTDAEVKHKNQNEAVLEFVDFWKESKGRCPKMLIFDSKFTTYKNLSKLNDDGIKFLTLRRRGENLKKSVNDIVEDDWKKIKIDGRRKHPVVKAHDSRCHLRQYDGEVRQIIIKDNGRENPTFLITNDFKSSVGALIKKYARRWLVEQEIAEQVNFFHLNQPSSSIVVKVDFDLTLSLLAHNLYRVLAAQLDGFENSTVPTLYRNFLETGAQVKIDEEAIVVSLKKKTHMPVLFSVPWMNENTRLSWMGASIRFQVGTVS